MPKRKKPAVNFKAGLFLVLFLLVVVALGVIIVIHKTGVKVNAGASGSLIVNFPKPRVYANFVDAGGKLAACDGLETSSCSTPNYTYWPGSSVGYYLRVTDIQTHTMKDIKSGHVTASSTGSVKVSWTLNYEVQAFLNSKTNCGDSGSECQKVTIPDSTRLDPSAAFILLRAGYDYRVIACTPTCTYAKPQILNKVQKSQFPGNMECAADANWDGTVNSQDLQLVFKNYGPVAAQYLVTPSPYDMNFDKVVDPIDLSITSGQYGKTCALHKSG